MAEYGYDEEIGKLMPQDMFEEYHICAPSGEVGKEFNQYMEEIVSKMLLAKNVALLNDETKVLADNIRQNQENDENMEALEENYLASHVIEKDGKVIDNMEQMREYVRENFLFVLQDSEDENAWICPKKEGVNVLSVSKKMLDFAENSSQLEGVVAHELGHFFVNQIYENATNSNVNETLADKHAVDMLYYMGKNPDEYRLVLERVHGLNELSDVEAILVGIADEHGSPRSRIQAIENYEEVKYGDYIENFTENAESVEKSALDDEKFNSFKERLEEQYANGRYVGYLENKFMEDDKFRDRIVEGKVDWAQVSYEEALDKLIDLEGDESFKFSIRLKEAGDILGRTDGSKVEVSEDLEKKASQFFMRATDSVFLGIEKTGKTIKDRAIEKSFDEIKRNDYQDSLTRVLLDEAKDNGIELDALGLALKLEEVLEQNGVVLDGRGVKKVNYNGKELVCGGWSDTHLLTMCLDGKTKVLSDDVKNHRADYAYVSKDYMLDQFGISIRDSKKGNFVAWADDLAFCLSYPEISLEEYGKEYGKCGNDKKRDECEERFYQRVYDSEPIKLDVPSVFGADEDKLRHFVNGKSEVGLNKRDFLQYSSLAFKLPEFVMPAMEDAVGQKLPWSELLENAEDKKDFLRNLRQLGVGIDEGVMDTQAQNEDTDILRAHKFGEVFSKVKFEGESYDFIADESGTIIAVGDEARELRYKKNHKKEIENDEKISSCFETQMKVYDALITLGEYRMADVKTKELTDEASKSLDYILRVEDFEQYVFCRGMFDRELKAKADKRKDLDYSNMGNDEIRINEDYEKLKASKLYRMYGAKEDRELTTDEKKKEITDFMNLRLNDRTLDVLEVMKEPIINVLKRNKEKGERDIEDVAYGLSRIKSGDENEDKKISGLVLELYDYVAKRNGYRSDMTLLGARANEIYIDKKIDLFEGVRKSVGFEETKGNPEALYANLSKKSDEEKSKGVNLAVLCFGSNSNYMPEYEVLRYINDKDNPKLDVRELVESYPKVERNLASDNSDGFRNKFSEYVLENGFKELSFYEQKEVFDQMNHKGLFGEEENGKLVFLEEIKKSYQMLPEEEKEEASLLMLKDRVIEYEAYSKNIFRDEYTISNKTNTISAVTYAPIRNYFVEEYTERLVERIGKEPVVGDIKEDGGKVSLEEVKEYQNEVVLFMNMVNQDMVVGGVKDKIFEVFADKIEAQRETAERFEVAVKHQDNDRDLGFRNEASARVVSSLNQFLDVCPNANMEVVDFLTKPYSKDSAVRFKENCFNELIEIYPKIMASQSGEEEKPMSEDDKKEVKQLFDEFSNEDLQIMHAEFWDKGLEERAAVMQRFLENYAKNDVDKKVDVVVSKYIDKDDPYEKETKDVLKALYKGGIGKGYYRKDKARFMLGAMLSAKEPVEQKNDGDKKMGVGEALAQFCSSNGPAWVKFGQALSNVPNLPDDIRRPLAVLKDNAVKKKRWEIFRELRENVGDEKLKEIRRVGKVLGAGSFFSSLAVEYDNGDKNVLQMMRPRAKKDADSEFMKIKRTVKDLSQKDSMYAVLGTIIDRADESTKTEVDIKRGYEQYVEAYKSYNAIDKLEVNGVKFNINLCPWTDWSYDEKTGAGFKAMEFGEGKSLPKLDCSEEEKRIIATGYVATELGILISGRAWDIDRHSGQQNFDIKRGKDGKIEEVDINIFDTGALRKPPTEEEKLMIANFYASVIRASVKGEDINDVMFREVENLEKRGVDAGYVSDVQRGSIAIADIVEYQKEERNNGGEVVRPSKSLSQDDFVKIFSAVVVSGMVDHKIMDNMVSKLVKDKELLFEIGKQTVKKKMAQLGRKKGNSEEALDVVMEAKPLLEQKRENQKIDEELKNSKDNPFTRTQKYSDLSKDERKEVVREERKGNKFSRNLQAWYLKKTRHSK
ncbi:MAG: hypothetical protein IJZ30_05200 [Alphaproteobacteria bacterium]|nr:hypothetical protein [Alphaproteobacteria bacterium]